MSEKNPAVYEWMPPVHKDLPNGRTVPVSVAFVQVMIQLVDISPTPPKQMTIIFEDGRWTLNIKG